LLSTASEEVRNGEQGAETFDPRGQKAQAKKERRRKKTEPAANRAKLSGAPAALGLSIRSIAFEQREYGPADRARPRKLSK
jgi:hypothetical protein